MASDTPKWASLFMKGLQQTLNVKEFVNDLEKSIHKSIERIQEHVFAGIINGVVFLVSLLALIAGSIMVVSKFVPIEYLLLIFGVIGMFYVVTQNYSLKKR